MNNFERDVANEMLDKADARIAQLEKARDLSAEASATMRDESIAKSERIAKLESAYAKAYARVGTLEAALRDLVDYSDPTKHVDADALTAKVREAWRVLGLQSETKVKPHAHRWTSKEPDAFCEDCLAERYPTENPPDA